ncbi:MAG: hypothetical protein AAF909_11215 [Pseudomonadota bacterium]
MTEIVFEICSDTTLRIAPERIFAFSPLAWIALLVLIAWAGSKRIVALQRLAWAGLSAPATRFRV